MRSADTLLNIGSFHDYPSVASPTPPHASFLLFSDCFRRMTSTTSSRFFVYFSYFFLKKVLCCRGFHDENTAVGVAPKKTQSAFVFRCGRERRPGGTKVFHPLGVINNNCSYHAYQCYPAHVTVARLSRMIDSDVS